MMKKLLLLGFIAVASEAIAQDAQCVPERAAMVEIIRAYARSGWPVGTLCITIAANIAETALLTFEACFPDSVVGFLADPDKVDASYVEFFLRTARADLEAFAPATAQKNINLDTLSNIRLPVPGLDEQIVLVRGIETAFAWIDRLASEATSARKLIDHLDQAVLAKAFRGELVPQDPNDEPASVLLKRIRAERAAIPR